MERHDLELRRVSGRGPVPRSSAPRRSGGGFTLLEILVAMAILAVAMLGIVKMQMMSGHAVANSRSLTAATNLCRGKIEDLRRIRAWYKIKPSDVSATIHPDLVDPDPGTDDLGSWDPSDHSDGGTMNEGGAANGPFTRQWNVRDNYPAPGLKTVRVRVAWTDFGGPRQVALETQTAMKTLEYYQ